MPPAMSVMNGGNLYISKKDNDLDEIITAERLKADETKDLY